MRTASDRVREILATAEVDGLHVRLPGQIDRSDYVKVDQALTAIGGKWNRRARAHVFTTDPGPALAGLRDGGNVPAPARTAEGYVATSENIADMVCRYPYANLADLSAHAVVLEPSAGDGAIVRAIYRANPVVRIDAIEPNADRARLIGHGTVAAVDVRTFEDYAASCHRSGARYDAVIMNPPFSVPGNRTIWIDHVRLAWSLLAPGGRLVAIVPAGYAYRSDKAHAAMRELIEEHGGADDLPADAFKSSGTGTQTIVIWADKPQIGAADDLHNADGSHISTARTANGADVERHERQIRAHLAGREAVAPATPSAPRVPTVEPIDGDAGDARRLSTAETAKLVRAALKAHFPDVKFSVRSDNYSMGSSVHVSWTDGPADSVVEKVTNPYRGADFDGMQDLKSPRGPVQITDAAGKVSRVRLGADFVMTHRDVSPEYAARFEALAAEILGEPVDRSRWYDGDYATRWGVWRACTGHNLLQWLAERVDPAELAAGALAEPEREPVAEPATVSPWAALLAGRR